MSSSSIFIGKLSSRMRTYELEDEFKRFGKIRDIEFKKDRGFAFIEYYSSDAAKEAIRKMDDRKIQGARIIVEQKGRDRRSSVGRRDRERDRDDYRMKGPQRSDVCYNCQGRGHWANECKNGDWRNKCYRCGKEGHHKRDCEMSRSPSRRRYRSRYSRSRSYSSRSRSYSSSYSSRSGSSDSSSSRSRSRSRSRHRSKKNRSKSRSTDSSRSYSKSGSSSSSRSNSRSSSKSDSRSKSKSMSKSHSRSRSKSNSKSK
ncbi:Zinc finger, CCHC-type [Pseudocohnilembus persalinus]|uniref:Zinc finger, CCHC-type n=1 Tax=Pseudocohnilembus persalinus TaxID=266149 RepID=A0A0V0QM22_PSEPJ|nr:Zinc finger, CCHC-type [Pseudocohnilembus persalinus]|eukprot:KRX03294.1 Zinc finger, CCHC-type [Pseudocohnilembus persalinus]